jgi:arsenite/tail-anchored protein-transporting ATPase
VNPFLESPRHLFFTGKGGVGKTTLACAAAISLADAGRRVLLVSTDPASNLDEMLGVPLGDTPASIPAVPRLSAMNIDPEAAAEAYRRRVLAPYEGTKTDEQLRTIREQLSGACTTEIAAFDQFAGLLSGLDLEPAFDHVVFDTAPTGHTLRLLQLPRAWTTFLDSNDRGASCLGPHSGLTMRQERFAAALRALSDPGLTQIVLVTRPNEAALGEAARTSLELRGLDVQNQRLAVNGIFRASNREDSVAVAFERHGAAALEAMPAPLRALPSFEVALRTFDMVGIETLRGVLRDEEPREPAATTPARATIPREQIGLASLVDELALGDHGLVMVMGKGGVGKTTVAAALAIAMARRGIDVHLSTTDPAAHVAAAIGGAVAHLAVSRIDPAAETRAYTERVMSRKGAGLDDEGRALLAEDLRSPCTEEVAVFHAFARLVSQARKGFVILDTAPTGHTLLLLDATGSYHRDVLRGLDPGGAARLVTPLMRLQDPSYTKIILVTLAERTPVSEAAQLEADLKRAGIEPYAWVINSCVAATDTRDPLLQRRARLELEQIERVRREHATRVAVIPWLTEEPVGPERLARLSAAPT